MKKITTILVLCLLFTACKTEQKEKVQRDGYYVTGNAPGVYNGIRAYLNSTDERGRQVAIDTAIVMNEKFVFEGKVTNPQISFLTINSVNGLFPFVLEDGEINIDVNADNIRNSTVGGSDGNKALVEFEKEFKSMSKELQDLNKQLNLQTMQGVEASSNPLNTKIADLTAKMGAYPFEFIEKNKDNVYSLILIEGMTRNNKANFDEVLKAFNSLDEGLKNSAKAQIVNTQIKVAKTKQDAVAATEIGKLAPTFSAPTPDGKTLSLNDVKGKLTLVDFWASWCKPCRRENPNVVKVYNKYHDKGLEIISISLDGSRTQKDPKNAWLKAIEDDKLTWNHVSNLSYFNDPVARAYNVQSIPATFLLDENGTIVAKNLRGPALENKVAELLN
ncbi:TlpA disulfide reductase family protein [uncultured Psychroserpens sp.]|uniref:TlpA disulfide reductase family protein n=1 Tax=uncultured Psychroserpens sp. TaxID=255436 RepID=UPI00262092C2|nr:TlpA disulfide reductase family protein [uncultured Psychroserpens sp.]